MSLSAPCYSPANYWQSFDISYAGMRVLDIGSSIGSFSRSRAFDRSRRSLREASLYVSLDIRPSARPVVTADAHRLPFKSESFDIIVANNVIEHLADAPLGVAEMRRVLRPGGTLLYTIPFLYPVHEAPRDYARFTEHGLRHLFREFGSVEVHPRGGLFSTVAQFAFLATRAADPLLVGGAARTLLYPFAWALVQLDRWDRSGAFARVYYGKLRR
jgi:SAM-dependent methyltransferase